MTWQPGESGNPKGKRTETRDKITHAFLNKLDEVWRKHGTEALESAARDRPAEFCRMMASLLPKDQNLKVDDGRENPFLQVLIKMNEEDKLGKENARLKEEIAALKGETPGDEPAADISAVH